MVQFQCIISNKHQFIKQVLETMPSAKQGPRSTSGYHNSAGVFEGQTKSRGKTITKDRSSSSATVSSLESETNAKQGGAFVKKKPIQKQSSSSASSGYDRNKAKSASGKPKKKLKSKSKKGKKAPVKGNPTENSFIDESGITSEENTQPYDGIENLVNETLRWSNVCSDSEEEEERLRLYKENRRERYIEAMQVKIVQRMSGFTQV